MQVHFIHISICTIHRDSCVEYFCLNQKSISENKENLLELLQFRFRLVSGDFVHTNHLECIPKNDEKIKSNYPEFNVINLLWSISYEKID